MMPPPSLYTVPSPLPVLLTVSVKRCSQKVAVIVLDALIDTSQVASLVESHPLHPSKNLDPTAGDAVSVTIVPLLYDDVQPAESGPQSIPESFEVTLPRPLPAFVTVSVDVVKVAVTDRAAL